MAAGNIVRRLLIKLGIQADTKKIDAFEDKLDDVKDAAGEATAKLAEMSKAGLERLNTGVLAVTAALAANTYAMTEHGVAASNMATALGISTTEMQRLGYAAEIVGEDMQTMHDAIQTMGERARDAIVDGPTSDAATMISQLGIVTQDTNGQLLDNATIWFNMVDALAAMDNATDRAGAAMTLLGDDGARLMPVMVDGAAGLKAFGDEAERMGAIMSEDDVAAANALDTEMRQFKATIKGFQILLARQMIPALKKVLGEFNKWIHQAGRIDRISKIVIKTLKVFTRILKVLFAAKAAAMIYKSVAAITAFAKALKTARMAAQGLQGVMLRMAAPMLAAAGFVVLLQDMVVWLRGGDSLIGRFIDKFKEADGPLGSIARGLETIKPVLQVILSQATDLAQRVMPVLRAAVGQLMTLVMSLLSAAMPIVVKLGKQFAAVVSGSWGKIQSTGKSLWSLAQTVGTQLIDVFGEVFGEVLGLSDSIFELLRALLSAAIEIIVALIPIIKVAVTLVIGLILALLPIVIKLIRAIIKVILWLIPIALRVIKWIIKATTKLIAVVIKIIIVIIDVATRIVTAIMPIVVGTIERIVSFITNFVEGAITIFTFVMEVIGDIINSIAGFIGSVIRKVADFIAPIAAGFIEWWNRLVRFVAPIIGAIANVIGRAFQLAMDMVQPVIDGILQAINLARELAGKDALTFGRARNKSVNVDAEIAKTIASSERGRANRRTHGSASSRDNSIKIEKIQLNVTSDGSPSQIASKTQGAIGRSVSDIQRRQTNRDLAAGG